MSVKTGRIFLPGPKKEPNFKEGPNKVFSLEHLVKLIDDHIHGKHFGRTTVSDDFPYAWPIAEL